MGQGIGFPWDCGVVYDSRAGNVSAVEGGSGSVVQEAPRWRS